MFCVINKFDNGKFAVVDLSEKITKSDNIIVDKSELDNMSKIIPIQGYKDGEFYDWFANYEAKSKLLGKDMSDKYLPEPEYAYTKGNKVYPVVPYYSKTCRLDNIIPKYKVSIDLQYIRLPVVRYLGYFMEDSMNLSIADLSGITSNDIESMVSMFNGCNDLHKVIFNKNLDTSKLKNMNLAFAHTWCLRDIDLSMFNSESLVDINFMFNNSGVTSIKFGSEFKLNKVTSMLRVFYDTSRLTHLNLSMLELRSCYGFFSTFSRSGVEIIDLQNIHIDNLNLAKDVFKGCGRLRILDLRNAFIGIDQEADLSLIFDGCNSLREVIVNRDTFNRFSEFLKNRSVEKAFGLSEETVHTIIKVV